MDNVYDPNPNDVLEWLNEKTSKWPESDWDYYVMNGKNDELVFDFANDNNCEKQLFFLHCLYYLVGDFFNKESIDQNKLNRINLLVESVNKDACLSIKKWANEVNLLFNKEIEFDTKYWLHFMFFEDTKKLDSI